MVKISRAFVRRRTDSMNNSSGVYYTVLRKVTGLSVPYRQCRGDCPFRREARTNAKRQDGETLITITSLESFLMPRKT